MAPWVEKDAGGFFTACLVVVAVVQLWLFWVQLRYIRRSLEDAEKVATIAADTAAATKDQAEVARDNLTKIQRPYIYVFGVHRLMWPSDRESWKTPYAPYTVANYGQTPASVERLNVQFSSGTKPEKFPGRVDEDSTLLTFPILAPEKHTRK